MGKASRVKRQENSSKFRFRKISANEKSDVLLSGARSLLARAQSSVTGFEGSQEDAVEFLRAVFAPSDSYVDYVMGLILSEYSHFAAEFNRMSVIVYGPQLEGAAEGSPFHNAISGYSFDSLTPHFAFASNEDFVDVVPRWDLSEVTVLKNGGDELESLLDRLLWNVSTASVDEPAALRVILYGDAVVSGDEAVLRSGREKMMIAKRVDNWSVAPFHIVPTPECTAEFLGDPEIRAGVDFLLNDFVEWVENDGSDDM